MDIRSLIVPGLGHLLKGQTQLGLQYLLAAALLWPLVFLNLPTEAHILTLLMVSLLHLSAAFFPKPHRWLSLTLTTMLLILGTDLLVHSVLTLPFWEKVIQSLPQFLVGKLRSSEHQSELWRLWGFLSLAVGSVLGWSFFERNRRNAGVILWATSWVLGGILLWPLVFPSQIVGGLAMSLILTFLGIGFSLPIGVSLGMARTFGLPLIRGLATVWIDLFRSLPFIAVIFWFFFFVPYVLGQNTQFVGVVVALVVFTSAYIGEIVRSGLEALPKGQMEAAKSLGLSGADTLGIVLLPQALRNTIPPLVGQCISLFKDTSLTSIVAVEELSGIARQVQSRLQVANFEVFVLTAALYFICAYGLSILAKRLEHTQRSPR